MIKGNFYFKKTINGNLLGEFSNDGPLNGVLKSYTESADLISNIKKDDFEGLYHSTWYENEACCARLEIKKSDDIKISKDLYFLKWTEGGNFEGQGMLCENNVLIGNYWSSNVEK